MNTYKIVYEDGHSEVTGFNGSLEDAQAYYVGTAFNFGDTEEQPDDLMIKAVAVIDLGVDYVL